MARSEAASPPTLEGTRTEKPLRAPSSCPLHWTEAEIVTTGSPSLLVVLLIALPLRAATAFSLDGELTEEEAATARRAVAAGGAELRTWCRSNSAQIDKPAEPLMPGGRTLLGEAVMSRDEVRVRRLLGCGANPSAPDRFGDTPLHLAPLSGMSKLLIAAGAKVNSVNRSGETPLLAAIGHRDEEMVVRLLARGANPNAHAKNPPLVVATAVFPKVVRMLLERGADPRSHGTTGRTALHEAAATANLPVAKLLIRRGAPVGARDEAGGTALHVLASAERGTQGGMEVEKNGVRFAMLLLDHRIDIDAQDATGQTALHRTARGGLDSLLRFLIERKASLEMNDRDGRMPLQVAAHLGRVEVMKELLAAGANPRWKDAGGDTALHLAAGGMRGLKNYSPPRDAMQEIWMTTDGHLAVIDLLLAAGVDSRERNGKGQTAEQLARERGLTGAADRIAR